ncbi:30S ribosomal protein S4 [bacterium]|uniref:Small ribosomal subunit protein uS4 n=2 Tax=Katanobacteria TaxID=422282 RepID=A0A2M7X052_UNCKA|nr:30S ribosomal protein S4 [bacterium]PIP56641.1 MAG: 30S ribosomal protein S4 [candidate division WWE3 bacterium CG22_combo_CG10-13_8_21_14_all_39_12]PJA39361.1 MAG: 30S ribosomal protein S4 [candidate division WWE3 bacterium CG_4_9_14_3_um_filter_39_7]
MARYTGPQTKRDRRFKLLPESMVEEPKTRGRHSRKSEFGIRLEEKQKLKHIYGVLEKQFRRYFEQAQKTPMNTGLVLMQQLENRLDNVVYRLGFLPTRRAARQFVNHGNVLVNGKRIDVPSYNVKEGDKVTLKEKALSVPVVVQTLEDHDSTNVPAWLIRSGNIGTVRGILAEDDLRDDIDIQLIIEYYSR